jgi:hypothetical protein
LGAGDGQTGQSQTSRGLVLIERRALCGDDPAGLVELVRMFIRLLACPFNPDKRIGILLSVYFLTTKAQGHQGHQVLLVLILYACNWSATLASEPGFARGAQAEQWPVKKRRATIVLPPAETHWNMLFCLKV